MALDRTNWMRNKEGAGLWEHRGKVAIAGWGTSPMDRRWDGKSLDKTMGAYTMIAVKNAIWLTNVPRIAKAPSTKRSSRRGRIDPSSLSAIAPKMTPASR